MDVLLLPTKESVTVLTQSILPLSLHYINPRTIMGEKAWNVVKKNVQRESEHCCMCCGRYIRHIPGDWIETHEIYNFDREKHEVELIGFIGLCHECHSFIHQGRLRILLAQGQISLDEYKRIIQHGESLLKMFNLTKHDLPAKEIENPNWYLLYNGEKYRNDYYLEA